jgi:hypothetical protein
VGECRVNGVHTLEDAAYELIIAGWEIFPLRGKIPWISKADGGQGHLDATSDDRQVCEWWTRWPTANIGGRPAETVIAIDLDPRNGGTLQRLISMAGEISPTLRSFSGRGDGGMHLFYDRGDLGEIDRSRLNPLGINVKDHDGYIVLPPSTHPESRQPYVWDTPRPITPLPEGLRSLLTPQPRSFTRERSPKITGGLINKRLARMLETVASAPSGSRNDTLNDLAYRAVTELGLADNLAVHDLFVQASQQAGLPDHEILGTLRSAGFRS